jgi:hypothetical protein
LGVVMMRLVALCGLLLGGCGLDASGLGGADHDGSGGGTTTGGASETGMVPATTVGTVAGTGQGDGSSSTAALDDGSTSGGVGSSTEASGDTSSSGDGSSTGDVPVLACPDRVELAGCWDFADLASGTLWDGSGNDNHGTVAGVGVEPGPFAEAATFDDDSEIAVPDSASLDIAGSLSVEIWVRVDALPSTGRVGILDKDGQYSLMIYADGGYRCNMATVNVFATPVLGVWTHLACVYDGAALRLYLDGTEVGSAPASGPVLTDNALPMGLGDTSPDFFEPLAGAIGGVRVWSRALDPAELCEAAGAACSG